MDWHMSYLSQIYLYLIHFERFPVVHSSAFQIYYYEKYYFAF
jgi:hypothetical protein